MITTTAITITFQFVPANTFVLPVLLLVLLLLPPLLLSSSLCMCPSMSFARPVRKGVGSNPTVFCTHAIFHCGDALTAVRRAANMRDPWSCPNLCTHRVAARHCTHAIFHCKCLGLRLEREFCKHRIACFNMYNFQFISSLSLSILFSICR